MNIGIDIDGTITAMPWLFKILTEGLRKEGHKIFIITFRDEIYKEETEKMFSDAGIVYDKIYYGKMEIDPEWKAEIAQKQNIDVIFEDDENVIKAMPVNVITCRVHAGWPYRY